MFIESFDGTNIYYEYVKRSDICLVFIHGWVNNWTTWKKEIEYFSQKNFSTLYLDLRGHGSSDKPDNKNKYSFECFAKDIHIILQKEQVTEFVLIGHSMGGMIALKYFDLFHKASLPKALVLTDTTYKNILEHKNFFKITPFIEHLLDFFISKEHIKKSHHKLKDIDLTQVKTNSDYEVFLHGLHQTPLKVVFSSLESMLSFDATKVLNTINIPVLVIEGYEDKLLPILDGIELYEEIEDGEIDFIPSGKHFVNISNSDKVDFFIGKFLNKHVLK